MAFCTVSYCSAVIGACCTQAEKEKNRKRAERFQLDYVEPSKVQCVDTPMAWRCLTAVPQTKVFGVKRAAVQQGFATGFDLTTDEVWENRRMVLLICIFFIRVLCMAGAEKTCSEGSEVCRHGGSGSCRESRSTGRASRSI